MKKYPKVTINQSQHPKRVTQRYKQEKLMLSRSIYDDGTEMELLFLNLKTISKKKYLQIRAEQGDLMPLPGAGLLEDNSFKEWKAAFSKHICDPSSGIALDASTQQKISTMRKVDAAEHEHLEIRLGSYGASKSRAILNSFFNAGCAEVFVESSFVDFRGESDTIYVRLPLDAKLRKKAMLLTGKYTLETGYEAPFDDGQAFQSVSFE